MDGETSENAPLLRASVTSPDPINGSKKTSQHEDDSFHSVLLGGFRTYFLQLWLLLEKQFLLAIRAWYYTLLKIIIPPAFIVGMWLVVYYSASATKYEEKHISPNICLAHASCEKVLYSPHTQQVFDKMTLFAHRAGLTIAGIFNDTSMNHHVVPFQNMTLMSDYFQSNFFGTWGGVAWYDPSFPDNFANENRDRVYYLLRKDKIIDGFLSSRELPANDLGLNLQSILDEVILTTEARKFGVLRGNQSASLDISYLQAPITSNGLPPTMMWQSIFPLFFVAAIFIHVGVIVNGISYERTKKLRQGLNMMGLQTGAYWMSWFLTYAVYSFITTWLIVMVGYVARLDFFINTSIAVLFFLFYLTALAANCFALTVSAIFHRPALVITTLILGFLISAGLVVHAAILGSFVFGDGGIFLYLFEVPFYQSHAGYLIGMIANAALIPTMDPKTGKPLPPVGFQWKDLYTNHSTPAPARNPLPTGSEALGSIAGIAACGFFLAFFIDSIWPGNEGGVPQKFFFLFDPVWWGIVRNREPAVELTAHSDSNMGTVIAATDIDIFREHEYTMKQSRAQDPKTMLRVLHLAKTFTRGGCCACCACSGRALDHRALDNLTVSGERGTILAILGHNGAGKTTLINLLTGLFPSSSGDAFLLNRSILTDLAVLRQKFGVCPQHDIIWPELTPYEHLQLIAKLKGVPSYARDSIIMRRLDEVSLTKEAHKPVGTFSGGMKRRVSVAMANIGDPEIIFLDEPTTGLDPKNRLQLWKIIESMKKDRLVVLTTHSMEEADALADKIAIMALGNLRAIGNSMHLKNRFGAGYHIEVICQDGKSDIVKDKIIQIMPDAVLNVESSGNLSYTLPTTRLDMLQKFFLFLEGETAKAKGKSSSLIQDWGISQTTLEEVFLRLTHGDSHTFASQKESGEKQKNLNIAFVDAPDKALGFVLVETITTLRDVRFAMDQIEGLRLNYEVEFMMSGVPIARSQEESLFATDFLPSLLIRKKSDQSLSVTSSPLLVEEAQEFKKEEVKNLKKKLKAAEAENDVLRDEVETLKKRIMLLEEQLKKSGAI